MLKTENRIRQKKNYNNNTIIIENLLIIHINLLIINLI